MKRLVSKGFTLIEVIVVAAIIAVLAGIIVPLVFKEIDNAKISRAQGDMKSIQSAMMVFKKDTGLWPRKDRSNACAESVTLLTGDGNLPSGLADVGFDTTSAVSLSEYLINSIASDCYGTAFKGPYIPSVTADPWGNAYVINADGFAVSDNRVWILSAGPNGIMETNPRRESIEGDDIGIRIK